MLLILDDEAQREEPAGGLSEVKEPAEPVPQPSESGAVAAERVAEIEEVVPDVSAAGGTDNRCRDYYRSASRMIDHCPEHTHRAR